MVARKTLLTRLRTALSATFLASMATLVPAGAAMAADPVRTITIDWAYYNPVSLVLKSQGLLEKEFAHDGISIRWVQSLGSNKAIEFLNAKSVDFGSTAGAAALLARANGAPIRSIYVYSKPEWTALVAAKGSTINSVADLKGKRIAVTRGTDPYIFLLRALGQAGLTEKDIRPVLLQHQDGRAALERGDVDAWAGLDPMMAQAEVEGGARLFHRNADLNTYGVLNVRDEFAQQNGFLVQRVIGVYERARKWSLENPTALKSILMEAAKLEEGVARRQLERTDLRFHRLDLAVKPTLIAAGLALQESGVIDRQIDVGKIVNELIDGSHIASGYKG